MIGKVCARGKRVSGLLRYLYATGPAQQEGRGGRNPHVDPRVIGGFDDPDALEPEVTERGHRDFRRLAALLEQPLVAGGVSRDKGPVYHLVISAAKDKETGQLVDPLLSDEQWRDIAETYMDSIGLARRGDDEAVRWVAVRHADDHVHVVATLARQDGRRVFPHNDFFRIGEANRAVEARYGLTVTADSDRTAAKRPTYAEQEKAARQGRREPVRDVLRRQVRTAAAGARSLKEFLEALRDDGVLVRERMSERNPGEITGYAVASPHSLDPQGKPIYFGGGKLAADLTLPKLRRRWDLAVPPSGATQSAPAGDQRRQWAGRSPGDDRQQSPADGHSEAARDRLRLTPEERTRIWEQAIGAAGRATEHVQAAADSDPRAAADAAWAASDFLAAAARVVEGRRGGPLTDAAGDYDRAARELWGRTPPRSSAGAGLRSAAHLMAAARFVGRGETRQLLALLAQLAALSDAVTRLRENQHRAAQAAAARRATDHLRRSLSERNVAAAGSPGAGRAATATRAPRPGLWSAGEHRAGPAHPPPGGRRGPRR